MSTPEAIAKAMVYAKGRADELCGPLPCNSPLGIFVSDATEVAAVMLKLLAQCENIRDILKLQPAPKLGEWNWPQMVSNLVSVVNEAKGIK